MKPEDTEKKAQVPQDHEQSLESSERRKAVTKLAYASPVVAGILFSQRAAAQFSAIPPPPPG